jgi:senataxin
MVLLPEYVLCRDILTPSASKRQAPSKLSVEKAMKTYAVNQPQAEAIVTGVEQQSGFVLIQGPPGTGLLLRFSSVVKFTNFHLNVIGKTKTILGLVGAFLTTSANPIRVPGVKTPPTNKKKMRMMICAPSNAACDEILRRLRAGILDSKGQTFYPKIVRLGSSDSIAADARDLTIVSTCSPLWREINSVSRMLY